MKDYRVPTSLDDPKKAFIWDLDVFMLVMLGFGLGILTRQMVFSVAASTFFAYRWGKLKSGKHQWYFLHVIYWYLPMLDKSSRIPATHKREFLK